MTPRMTPSISYDAVDEASDESMVASDPPARGLVRTGEPRREGDAPEGYVQPSDRAHESGG